MGNEISSKFSKDPIVWKFSAEEFFKTHGWFYKRNGDDIKLLDDTKELEIYGTYYKFTSNFLVCVEVGVKYTNFGENERPKVEIIQVVERDGSEIDILRSKIEYLKKKNANPDKIKAIQRAIELIPPFVAEKVEKKGLSFNDYVIDMGYKTPFDFWLKEFVVLDLETNGLRTRYDDVLSISIYDPQSGKCYNRFLPLDLQPVVLTTRINGIKQEDLEPFEHITQHELDQLIEAFKLKERVVLVYSGGNGTFDSSFLTNYCKRHKLKGLEDLEYANIKNFMPDPGYGFEGERTKDNYCRLFGIEGVTDIHSGANDCLLEWKLFEAVANLRPFFNNGNLFSFSDEYIVPVTSLLSQPNLRRYKKIDLKSIVGIPTLVHEFKFPKNIVNKLRKFPTNITGITLENSLYSLISPDKQDNIDFLVENKKKCKFIGRLDSKIEEIPIVTLDDGTVKSLDEKYDEYIDEVNKVSEIFAKNITETVNYIKKTLFAKRQIRSEELVISDDKKVLAICDLSSDDVVLEIKTNNVMSTSIHTIFDFQHIRPEYALQLYYESKGRKPYIMSIVFDYTDYLNIKDVTLSIYSVELSDRTEEAKSKRPKLWILEQEVLDILEDNENITIADISRKTGRSTISIQRSLNVLRNWGYIRREGARRKGKWIIIPEDSENKV